jgi:lysophospholipase L1-like esterase
MLFTFAFSAAGAQDPDAPAKTNYLLMGDSIAEGFGVRNSDEASYGAIVAHTDGFNYNNIARTARTTTGLLNQITGDEYARALITQADIISLSIGGNDYFTDEGVVGIAAGLVFGIETPRFKELTAQMKVNFEKIIGEIYALNPDVVILAQTVLCSWYGFLGDAYMHGTQTVNDMIYGYLEDHPGAYEIVDVAGALNGHKEYIARDTVHPNTQGNIVIARLVLEKLKELGLGEKTEPEIIADGVEFDYYVDMYGEFGGKIIGFIVRLATGHNPF